MITIFTHDIWKCFLFDLILYFEKFYRVNRADQQPHRQNRIVPNVEGYSFHHSTPRSLLEANPPAHDIKSEFDGCDEQDIFAYRFY